MNARLSLRLLAAALFLLSVCARGQVYEKLYDFTSARTATLTNPGFSPQAPLVQGRDGNFYGTTNGRRPSVFGSVFRMSPDGVLTTLIEFSNNGPSNKGSYPASGLVEGEDGVFYGTTEEGGANNCGTVFKVTSSGLLSTLVEFTGNNTSNKGKGPTAALVLGSDGNFYGTTAKGGASDLGTVFRMTAGGVLTTLVEFTGNGASNKGSLPTTSLLQSTDGNFYGTTLTGGVSDLGTVFKVTPAGVLTTLAEFNGATAATGSPQTFSNTAPIAINDLAIAAPYPSSITVPAGIDRIGKVRVTLRQFSHTYPSDTRFLLVSPSGTACLLMSSAGGARPGASSITFTLDDAAASTVPSPPLNGGTYRPTPNSDAALSLTAPAPSGPYATQLSAFNGQSATGTWALYVLDSASGDTGSLAGGWSLEVSPTGAKGSSPAGTLVTGNDGNFYGTTRGATAPDNGTIFKLTPSGQLTTLADFTTNLGAKPLGGLVQAGDGNFYGTTSNVFSSTDKGTVFQMTPEGVLTTVLSFSGNGSVNKGSFPFAGLIQGSDGLLYGTTPSGGVSDFGTIFRMPPTGPLTTLVEFTGVGASNSPNGPFSGLVQGSDGLFYGTTSFGGASDFGTVFSMTPAGDLSVLVEFTGAGPTNKGSNPTGELVEGSDGSFYGTTLYGGANGDAFNGTIFKMTPAGVLTTLVEFGNSDGIRPYAGLLLASDGNFYGTTSLGGTNLAGTVFKMTPAGVLTTLVNFTDAMPGNKGKEPRGKLVQGSDGNFYGTTYQGGGAGAGTVFKMTPAGVLTTLVEFTGSNTGANRGFRPNAGLVQGSDGNFYGSTGGLNQASGGGTIFKMAPAGALTTLVDFTGSNPPNQGSVPYGALVLNTDGNFYGTTQYRGDFGFGTIFKVSAAGAFTNVRQFTESKDGIPTGTLITGTDGNLYGTTNGPSGSVYRLIFPGAPLVLTPKAAPTATSATLSAKLNARGALTAVQLEYGTDGVNFPNSIPLTVNLTGYQTTLLARTIGGLTSGMTYAFRFRATSSAGTTVSPTATFATLAPPEVTIAAPTGIDTDRGTFHGSVNPKNNATTVFFEYGTNENALVSTTPPMTVSTPQEISATVTGLTAGGLVFYRLRATNAAGSVISGVRSFSTVSVNTAALDDSAIGVTTATFKATINTFGQTASVKFRYWATSSPTTVLETETQTVTSNGPVSVSAQAPGLQESTSYAYQVSVEIAGTQTNGSAVGFTTETNQPPVAVADLIFYSGRVSFDPRENDTDPNEGSNANLLLDSQIAVPPSAATGVASVSADRRSISYSPQFNVIAEDALTYRVVDPLGAGAEAQVRLVTFGSRAGLYSGKFSATDGSTTREGPISLYFGNTGVISTSFFSWSGGSYRVKGGFNQRGLLEGTFTSETGALLTLSLTLDPNTASIHGTFEERVNGMVTASVPDFTLLLNVGTGGRAASGLRTAFLDAPASSGNSLGDGYLLMTVGKDTHRGARFAGRLPDGEPFLAGVAAYGRSYPLAQRLEQGGIFTGLVRAIDHGSASGGMMGNLLWKKQATTRARFERGGVDSTLSLMGIAYPATSKGQIPPIGLGATNPNARLTFRGGNLGATYRDILLNVIPGRVQVIGPDPAQSGADLSPNKFQLTFDSQNATFSGRLIHPATGKLVPFNGAFRMPFDSEAGQGRGNFRGPTASGSVRIVAP